MQSITPYWSLLLGHLISITILFSMLLACTEAICTALFLISRGRFKFVSIPFFALFVPLFVFGFEKERRSPRGSLLLRNFE